MRLLLVAALTAHCAATPAPAPASAEAICPPPSRPVARPRAFVPRDCDCAALCAPCRGGARVRPEDDEALAEARGRCPTWHQDCACPSCDESSLGEDPPRRPL